MKHPRPQIKINTPGRLEDEPEVGDLLTQEEMAQPARFYNVDGLPVSMGRVPGCPFRCAVWSDGRPRIFSEVRVHDRGKLTTEQAFPELILACKLGC